MAAAEQLSRTSVSCLATSSGVCGRKRTQTLMAPSRLWTPSVLSALRAGAPPPSSSGSGRSRPGLALLVVMPDQAAAGVRLRKAPSTSEDDSNPQPRGDGGRAFAGFCGAAGREGNKHRDGLEGQRRNSKASYDLADRPTRQLQASFLAALAPSALRERSVALYLNGSCVGGWEMERT